MAEAGFDYAHLLPQSYKEDIRNWLREDCPSFDYAGFVVGDAPGEARLLGKAPGILAGVPFFTEVFVQLGCSVDWHLSEGCSFEPVRHAATVRGPVRKILLGERVALNILARCSGIATKTARLVALVKEANPAVRLAGTRKTTPGLRLVEKYGMLVGGADPHRYDLSSMIMLKDNHIWACAQKTIIGSKSNPGTGVQVGDVAAGQGAITEAVVAARHVGGFSVKVEVEVDSEIAADEAIEAGSDVVMLDNFEPGAELAVLAQRLKSRHKGRDFLLEVSGGITEQTVGQYCVDGIDIVSTSSIHQGVAHLDWSLKLIH